MKTLLRSVMVVDSSDVEEHVLENVRTLEVANLSFNEPEDVEVWDFIKHFTQRHSHAPEFSTVVSHFDKLNKSTVKDRLNAIRSLSIKTRGDFYQHLEGRAEDVRKSLLADIIQLGGEIAIRGASIKEGKESKTLFGPMDAMRYMMERSNDVLTPTFGSKLSGNVTQDGEDFLKRYDKVKGDPSYGIGCLTGIRQMDEAILGAKPAELWTHAAFTGGLKTTMALNWAYTQAVYYGNSSLFFCLEMTYEQVRNLIFSMHSMHEKFEDIHPPLDYQDIRFARLTPSEEKFLKQHVVPDLTRKGQYGSLNIEMRNPDKLDFTVEDVRSRAQSLYSKNPYSMIFVDHAGLMASRRYVSSTTERLNEVIADCKRFALGFNRGQGIPLVLLFQISREGYRSALKARGLQTEGKSDNPMKQKARVVSDYVYNLTHLSYSSECEKSSDVVTTTWIDEELSAKNQVLFQCLKSRDQRPFDPFKAIVDWRCRRIGTLETQSQGESMQIGAEIDMMDVG